MAKRKEIKFRRDRWMYYGQQNGVKYNICADRRTSGQDQPLYYVVVTDPQEHNRSFSTYDIKTFDFAGAKEFCQQVAAGEIDPLPFQAAQAAAKASREQAAAERAMKQASDFQAKLNAHKLDYSILLDLIQDYDARVNDQARRLLIEWEQCKGEIHAEQEKLYRKITRGIDNDLYGPKGKAHSGPFQQDMVAYIMAKAGYNTAQANRLFIRAYTNRNTLVGVLREVDDLLDLILDLQTGTEDREA